MGIVRKLNKLLSTTWYLPIIVITFVVALSAIITLSNSVEQQSLLEQKSLTPAIDLITKEIIKPLYVAETIARASPLKIRMNDEVINQQKILNKLKLISAEFDMEFFVASEKSRMQYNSNGTSHPLIEGKVEWYFRAKATEQNIVAVLGNINDIRIYYDIKVFDEAGEFLGFIGVSRKLDTFLTAFEGYKKQFGYDFVFVDHEDNIVLSSDRSQVADGKRILKTHQLPWYPAFEQKQDNDKSHNNMVVDIDGEDLLIAEANIDALKWKVFLISPLKTRQNETTLDFVLLAIYILLPLAVILSLTRLIMPYAQEQFAKRYQIDP